MITTKNRVSKWDWFWDSIPKTKDSLTVWRHIKPTTKKVCISVYANVYLKTTIIKQNIKIILLQNNIHVSEDHCGNVVRFGQALPGVLLTPLVCISVVIGLLPVWRDNKPKTENQERNFFCDSLLNILAPITIRILFTHLLSYSHVCFVWLSYICTHHFMFFLFPPPKFDTHPCYRVYWCNHTPPHIFILQFLLYSHFVMCTSTIVRSLYPTLVFQTSKLCNDIYVWIH